MKKGQNKRDGQSMEEEKLMKEITVLIIKDSYCIDFLVCGS